MRSSWFVGGRSLFVVRCVLLVARWLLFVGSCCSLRLFVGVVRCLLRVVCCLMLFGVRCWLFVVLCVLCVAWCLLIAVCGCCLWLLFVV